MANCNLCHTDFADDEIEGHRRSVHPDVAADGTGKADHSNIIPDVANQAARRPHEPEDDA
ncbi:hypothetical protein L3i22_032270 [Actinoplanes sp. L3-i22]|nr:hypothetical protein L3i22_032270 [Actinoplanes sp. L3-i22]